MAALPIKTLVTTPKTTASSSVMRDKHTFSLSGPVSPPGKKQKKAMEVDETLAEARESTSLGVLVPTPRLEPPTTLAINAENELKLGEHKVWAPRSHIGGHRSHCQQAGVDTNF